MISPIRIAENRTSRLTLLQTQLREKIDGGRGAKPRKSAKKSGKPNLLDVLSTLSNEELLMLLSQQSKGEANDAV